MFHFVCRLENAKRLESWPIAWKVPKTEQLLTKVLRKTTQHMFSITLSGWKVGGGTSVTEQEQIQGGRNEPRSWKQTLPIEFCKYMNIKECVTKTESSDIFIPWDLFFFSQTIDQDWEVGLAGVGGSGGGEKWRQLYLNNNKKCEKMVSIVLEHGKGL